MFKANDFRHYAEECAEYARVSKPGEIRKHFIDMARMWTLAAIQLEEGRNKVLPLATSPDPANTQH